MPVPDALFIETTQKKLEEQINLIAGEIYYAVQTRPVMVAVDGTDDSSIFDELIALVKNNVKTKLRFTKHSDDGKCERGCCQEEPPNTTLSIQFYDYDKYRTKEEIEQRRQDTMKFYVDQAYTNAFHSIEVHINKPSKKTIKESYCRLITMLYNRVKEI